MYSNKYNLTICMYVMSRSNGVQVEKSGEKLSSVSIIEYYIKNVKKVID